jgi:DNA-binding CsgD family transcriptional regulator
MKHATMHLTDRQRECLEAVCTSPTHTEAAYGLYISVKTLRNTLTAVQRALEVSTSSQACYLLGQVRGYKKEAA